MVVMTGSVFGCSEIARKKNGYFGEWEMILAVTVLYLASQRTVQQIGDVVGRGASTVRGYLGRGIQAIIDVFQRDTQTPAIR